MGLFDHNESGVAQLIGSKNNWAIELWKLGCNQNWSPFEVSMEIDIRQWKVTDPSSPDFITPDEKLLVKRTLGLFAAGESLVANSIDTAEFRYIADGACRQYLHRKAFEETLHNFTVAVCCEAYQLSEKEVAEAYLNIPTIKAKQEFLKRSLDSFDVVLKPQKPSAKKTKEQEYEVFDIDTVEGKQKFLKNMFIFYMICEGTWFFANFALIMSMGRQNKLKGLYDQIGFTIKDEAVHVEFGQTVMTQTQTEYPEVWTDEFKQELYDLMREGVEIELEYAKDILPSGGILGVSLEMLEQYIQYLGNMRLKSINMDMIFDNKNKDPFPWLNEAQNINGMSAFFERQEKSYQQAGALDDDWDEI